MTVPMGEVLWQLLGALAAGGVIGLERSFHGRPAGFRTHALVCITCSMLMLLVRNHPPWLQGELVRLDPTRMAQGIVTGIGFLGAGVIFREGLTVRGLTTAASIWVTSAIGILIGSGLYVPAAAGTAATIGVLTVFRRVESLLPVHSFAQHVVRFDRDRIMREPELRALLERHGVHLAGLSYRLTDGGKYFEYRVAIRTTRRENLTRLSETLTAMESVREFSIVLAND